MRALILAVTVSAAAQFPPEWTEDHFRHFKEHDFVILRNVLTAEEVTDLRSAVTEMETDPFAEGKQRMNYYERGARGQKMLCRTENFVYDHPAFMKHVLPGGVINKVGEWGLRESVTLFKERVNYKYPGGGAFPAHQDGLSWEGLADIDSTVPLHERKLAQQSNSGFLSAMINVNVALDHSNLANGCLEVAGGVYTNPNGTYVRAPQNPDGTITEAFQSSTEWTPAELAPGDLLVFGVAIPHRSGPNPTDLPRRTLYLTYNAASLGEFRTNYYRIYRENYPPENERVPGVDYAAGKQAYAFATPVFNVDDTIV